MPGAQPGVGRPRLVVCDRHDASWTLQAASEGLADEAWDVLLLGVSETEYRRRHPEALSAIRRCAFADLAPGADAARSEVAAYVLELVATLPSTQLDGRPIADWLRQREGSLWWSLEITEKSAFRSRILERLYRLSVLDRLLSATDYAEVWVAVGDELLADAIAGSVGVPVRRLSIPAAARGLAARLSSRFVIAYWGRAIRAALGAAAARVAATAARLGQLQPGADLVIYTMYPYWWLEPYVEARAVDRFFSAPPRRRRYLFAAWLSAPGQIWRRRHTVQRLFAARQIVPLQAWLTAGDILGVLSPRRYALAARLRARLAGLRIRFRRFDVSALVADDLEQSLADAELFFDHLVGRAMRRLLRKVRPSALLFRAEGQPWEAAMVTAAGSVSTVGFYHSPFGRQYPSLRFAADDFTAGPAGKRPLPASALVCGTLTRRYMVEDGYPGTRIAECGPQRHARFTAFRQALPTRAALRQTLGLPMDQRVYFVALAIVEVETEGLFACIERALVGRSGYQLVIKTHPNRPSGDAAMRRAIAALGQERVRSVPPEGEMYAWLAAADAMITLGSTVAFEAMALDVMPVVYEHPGTYTPTSLRAFEESLFVVDSASAMQRAIDEIEQGGDEDAKRRRRWAATLEDVFGRMSVPLEVSLDDALSRLERQEQVKA